MEMEIYFLYLRKLNYHIIIFIFLKISIQSLVQDPLAAISNEEIFHADSEANASDLL